MVYLTHHSIAFTVWGLNWHLHWCRKCNNRLHFTKDWITIDVMRWLRTISSPTAKQKVRRKTLILKRNATILHIFTVSLLTNYDGVIISLLLSDMLCSNSKHKEHMVITIWIARRHILNIQETMHNTWDQWKDGFVLNLFLHYYLFLIVTVGHCSILKHIYIGFKFIVYALALDLNLKRNSLH